MTWVVHRIWMALGLALWLAACGGGGAESTADTAAPAGDRARALATTTVPFTGNGFYWDPAAGGTGFMVEAQGGRMFAAFFVYDEVSGNPVWYAATGDLVYDAGAAGHRFTADLHRYSGGMALGATGHRSPSSVSIGTVSLSFSGGTAVAELPGGRTMRAVRFTIEGGNLEPPGLYKSHLPETGWFWNPDEGGRGYAVEVQGAIAFMAIFHYDLLGEPTWHVVEGGLDHGRGTNTSLKLRLYTGGQSLTSAYRAPLLHVVADTTLSFRGPCGGQLQVAGGPPIRMQRYVIDGSTQPPGSECAALSGRPDVPDIGPKSRRMAPGDTVHGVLEGLGDSDGYNLPLLAGTTYTFELQGAASGRGSLGRMGLVLHDGDLRPIAVGSDPDHTSTSARIVHTATYSGLHYLKVYGPGGDSGTFVLTASGVAPELIRYVQGAPARAYKGHFEGRLHGPDSAQLTFTIAPDGSFSGGIDFDRMAFVIVPLVGQVEPGGVVAFSASGVHCRVRIAPGSGFGFARVSGTCGRSGTVVGTLTPTVPFDENHQSIVVPSNVTVGTPSAFRVLAPSMPGRSFAWSFGDGGAGSGETPEPHVFQTPGVHNIVVTSLDALPPWPGGSSTNVTVKVLCADGTICTDFDQPNPSIEVDTADCVLRNHPYPSQSGLSKVPMITFAGRGSIPARYSVNALATGSPRTPAGLLAGPFTYWDQNPVWMACGGRDPCWTGPLTEFVSSPRALLGDAPQLQGILWPDTAEPHPTWLYVYAFDPQARQVVAVSERLLSCPATVKAPGLEALW